MNTIDLVAEFHRAFSVPIADKPSIHNEDVNKLRLSLLFEEISELAVALKEGTEEDVLDALTDTQVVLDGAYLSLGFYRHKDPAFRAVHTANMQKLDKDGKPIFRADGKILKPEGWQPPNLKGVLSMFS